MHRDIIIVCVLILAVCASAATGSAISIYALKQEITAEMHALRAQVEPSVCRLFATETKTGTGQP